MRFPMISAAVIILTSLAAIMPASAQTNEEIAFARQILTSIQDNSFAANREYCGIIGTDGEGRLVASNPRKGRRDSCRPRDPRGAADFIASFHTHAGFDEEADSEVPSPSDVIGDMEEGLDGFVATPGGRFWFIDGQTGVVRQLCGLGCLPQDPDFEAGVWGPIAKRYTLGQLEDRAEQ